MKFAMIADDLTGAADSGVQLVRAGYRTAVVFRGEPLPEGLDAAVVDTDSRSLPEEEARERVHAAGAVLKLGEVSYKKIDSTLRGSLSAELRAALEVSGRERAVVAPAFPQTGRTTVGGVQLLHGRPVHETELARDPRTPVRESHIPTLLQSCGPVQSLSREYLGEANIRAALERAAWVVADAASDSDLQALVRAVPDPGEVLWVGSAGLAGALSRAYTGPRTKPASEPAERLSGGRVLVVVGSASGVSREQLRRVAAEPGVVAVKVEPGAEEAARDRAGRSLGAGRSVALHTLAPEEGGGGNPEAIVHALSEVVVRLSDAGLFDALILTGGDTAVRVCRRLGASGILLADELEPGVPVGTLTGPRPYPVVTKAGAFGRPETLLDALRTLLSEPERTNTL